MTSMSASRNAVISLQSFNTCIIKWILLCMLCNAKLVFFNYYLKKWIPIWRQSWE
jgi:hypothetical protein